MLLLVEVAVDGLGSRNKNLVHNTVDFRAVVKWWRRRSIFETNFIARIDDM